MNTEGTLSGLAYGAAMGLWRIRRPQRALSTIGERRYRTAQERRSASSAGKSIDFWDIQELVVYSQGTVHELSIERRSQDLGAENFIRGDGHDVLREDDEISALPAFEGSQGILCERRVCRVDGHAPQRF